MRQKGELVSLQVTQIIRSLRTPVQTAVFVSLSVLVLCIHESAYDLTQLCEPFVYSCTGNG